jgi:hypothetical protein
MKTLTPEKATSVLEVIKMIEDTDIVTRRVKDLNWKQITEELNEQGSALLKNVLTPEQCEALSTLYPEDDRFRSRVVRRVTVSVAENTNISTTHSRGP